MPTKKPPRYRVGQVVWRRDAGRYDVIVVADAARGLAYFNDRRGAFVTVQVSDIQPLTKREIGQGR